MNDTRSSARTAAVIGSGFGGLALAIRLQAAGIRTTVLEKRDKPGGRAYVYEDQGFTFDGGPTVITDPSALRALWENAGRKMDDYVELLPVDPMYRLCWEDGTGLRLHQRPGPARRTDRRFNPADVDGYKRFIAYSYKVFEKGYLELGHKPFLNFGSMIKVAPDLMKLQAPEQRLLARSRNSSRTNTCARPSPSTRCWSAATRSRPRRSTP
jgi:phytoene desaturase